MEIALLLVILWICELRLKARRRRDHRRVRVLERELGVGPYAPLCGVPRVSLFDLKEARSG
jgi:hypothetical protein